MKVHIEDHDVLRAVSPAVLSAYVRSQGWIRAEQFGDHSDVYSKVDCSELILPSTVDIADYASVVSSVLGVLSRQEGRTELQIFRDLSVADCDVIRNRVPLAEDDGSVALNDGVLLFNQSKELLLAAACAAKEPRAQYRAGGVKDAKEYIDRVRLGQTEQGSFIVTLLTPVPINLAEIKQPTLWPEMASEPFERQVTRILVDSLAAAKNAVLEVVKGNGVEVFRNAVSRGVSVNSCAALALLAESGHGLDVSVTWARTRPTPTSRSEVKFTRQEGEIFREAARYLREIEPRPDEVISAFVVTLERGPEQNEGRVSLKTFLDGKPVSIATSLNAEMFRVASRAITDKQSISVKGDLIRRGQRWHLENPRELNIVVDDET